MAGQKMALHCNQTVVFIFGIAQSHFITFSLMMLANTVSRPGTDLETLNFQLSSW